MKVKLWTRDFSLLSASSFLSAVGGEAILFPLSLYTFDETRSPLLSALVMIMGFVPDLLLAIPLAPLVERMPKKKLILLLDGLLLALYLAMGFFLHLRPFSFWGLLLFTFAASAISIVYSLSYQAWLPDLIPPGAEQQGNAVGSSLYPFVTVFMAPLGGWLYQRLHISEIFFGVSLLLLCSMLLEARISYRPRPGEGLRGVEGGSAFARYGKDLREGFAYFSREKGLRNIGTYMGITNGCSAGIAQMTQYFFQTHPVLNVVMLGTLTSAQMLGRLLGGGLQYLLRIPPQRRFHFTCLVYLSYDLIDSFLLFMPYPLMLGTKFVSGALGTSSAIIRSTAYQCYLPRELRARVSAINGFLFSAGMALFHVISGLLAGRFAFRTVALMLGGAQLLALLFLIVLRAKQNRPVYEARRGEA